MRVIKGRNRLTDGMTGNDMLLPWDEDGQISS